MGAQQRAAENNSAWRLYGPPSTAQHRTDHAQIPFGVGVRWSGCGTGLSHGSAGTQRFPQPHPPPAAPRTQWGGSCCWKTSATGRKMGQRCRSVLYFLSGGSAGDMDGSLGGSQPRDRRLNSPGEFCYAKLGARRRTATPNPPPPPKTPHPNQHSPGPPRKGGSERGTNRTQRAHSTPESGRENRAPPGPAEPPPPPRTPEGQR